MSNIKLLLKIFFSLFLLMNFFFYFSNNKYYSSYIYNGKDAEIKFQIFSNKEKNNFFPTIEIEEKFKKKNLNHFLTEGFLCIQENNLFINEFKSKENKKYLKSISSISLQGAYFYNRKNLDKILLKFNHYENTEKVEKVFFNYFNYCFLRSFNIHYNQKEFSQFLLEERMNNNSQIFNNTNLTEEIIFANNNNFASFLYKKKSQINYWYYLSLICFTFTISIIFYSLYLEIFKKKR